MTQPWAGAATNRRHFLTLLGAGAAAVGAGGLLSGCSKAVSSRAATTDTNTLTGVLPKLIDLKVAIPAPDIVGVAPIPSAYSTWPSGITSVIPEAPGRGGATIKAMTPVWGTAPPGLANNAYLQAVNAKLGTPVDFSVQDGMTYADKLNAILGARDVPDLLCAPSWEVVKIPRMTSAAQALFEDLTPYLAGDAVSAYPMMAAFPTVAWQNSVWGERLYAVPNPTDGPFPLALFYRKDLLDKMGLVYPKTIDELFEVGKQVTNPGKGTWAFDDIFQMVQMYFKVPGSKDGWGLGPDGAPIRNIETPQFKAAAEFMAKVYKAGMVHPDVVGSKGADSKQLLQSGKIIFKSDGIGMWQGMQAEQQKITKGFKLAPVPIFSATGGDPLVWGDQDPISYTFIKKGLGKDRITELLRVINWCSAPFGTSEAVLRDYGVEGKHYTMSASGPVKTDLGFKELQNQYFFISGRRPVGGPQPATPTYNAELITYSNAMAPFIEKDPWVGIKIEWPAKFSANVVPLSDKITDIVRGRRPLSDLDAVIKEFKANGGDEARALLANALTNKGK